MNFFKVAKVLIYAKPKLISQKKQNPKNKTQKLK
jgi:hypothetical protein